MTLLPCLELLELSCDCSLYSITSFYCRFPIFDLYSYRSLNFRYRYFTLMILFLSQKLSLAPSSLCRIFRLDFIYFKLNYLIKMYLLLNTYVSMWKLHFYLLDYYYLNFIDRRFLMRRIASCLKKCFQLTFDDSMHFDRKPRKSILCDCSYCCYYLALEWAC